ncbi:MAG: DUF4372 domain-containing protein [Candidatus Omnitrophica bacterium]|nr:DUF4372 domain-containing protein [Candidatus Omnitrophota bacterium]MBU1128122.1 DUF4372 domain-containing protein [Candidatus Omnitrophota bacterium]MBU1784876.1 DUF4372 domain-containing protein [Candidatus Omnitrophota bacterium]MBU1850814.1 DUF4372 domain-containing protein [Candidatus Omnitrophota bacterium]
MNSGKTIFSQIMDFLPMNEFRNCVNLNISQEEKKGLSPIRSVIFHPRDGGGFQRYAFVTIDQKE